MGDIYATPEAELSQHIESDRVGGNIDDAVAGNFEIGMLETLGEAWRGLKGFKLKCWIAILLYLVVFIVLGIAFGIVAGIVTRSGGDQSVLIVFNIVFQIAITAVALPMSLAVLVMAMRHANDKSVSAGEIFRHFGVVGTLVIAYLLMTILMLIGFALLVLPGIYLMFAYVYSMPLIVEKKMGAWQAMETSRKAITRVWFRMVGLLIVIWFINMLGLVTIIGWIWTVPLTVLTIAMVYQKIFGVEAHSLAD